MFAERLTRVLNCKEWVISRKLDLTTRYISSSLNDSKSFYSNKNASCKSLCNKNVPINNCYIRRLRTNTVHFNYLSLESAHARNLLGSSDAYSNGFATPLSLKEELNNLPIDEVNRLLQKPWISMKNEEVLENFELLSYNACKNQESLSDSKYCGMLEVIINRCPDFNDKELHHLLNCLGLWDTKQNQPVLRDFFKVLDSECLRRMPNWSVDEIFLANDLLWKTNLSRASKFVSQSLAKVNPNQMTPAQLVQFAYLLKLNQKVSIDLGSLECSLEKCLDQLSIEELGIVAMAFFKYETQIKSKYFLLKIVQKLHRNIDDVSDITLSAILKILRYSIDLQTVQQFDILLNALVKLVPRCSIPTLTHIAHMQGRLLLHNEKLISELLNRYEKEISKARAKDIERILYTLYTFNYDRETPFYSAASNELLNPIRTNEIDKFPKSLVYSVLYMLQMNFYPEKALKIVMEQEFLNKISDSNLYNLDREYLVLDYCIELEHPEYNGPRLRKDILNFLLKRFGSLRKEPITGKQNNLANKLMIDVIHTCKKIFQSESAVHLDALLPHFVKSDIVVCYDPATKTFVSPSTKLSKIPLGSIKYAPKDGKKWYAMSVGTHNNMTRNTFEPTGILAVQLRHLKQIGYTPIMIPYNVWQHLIKEKQKLDYLKNILSI